MNIFLEEYRKDLKAFKKAIKLCKEDLVVIEILKKYQKRIEEEFLYANFLKSDFMPLIQNKNNFYRAFIFVVNGGDYRVDVFVHNADENIKKEYKEIYNNFCRSNEDTFFFFSVYDIDKDKGEYLEAMDYDRLTIKPKGVIK